MVEFTTFDEDNRLVRLLVFAVPEKSEKHGIVYMHTPCLSPLTSRTGIMTKRQHQIDMKGVEVVNKQDKCLGASLANAVRNWMPKVMVFGLAMACVAASLSVMGNQSGITSWGNENWRSDMTKLINETDPDLIVFDQSYTNNDDPHYPEGFSFVQDTCEQQLMNGKVILILDDNHTRRWEAPEWQEMMYLENSLTGETVERTCCRGDLSFMTDSPYLKEKIEQWSSTDNRHVCPRSIDDCRDEDSGFGRVLLEAMAEHCEDGEAYAAFPADMMQEEHEERGPIDSIEGPEDTRMPLTGEPTPLEEEEQNLLDEMPLPGMPKDEAERRRLWAGVPRRARAAIRRMHRMIGHKPKEVLLQVLRGAGADQAYIDAAKLYRCDDCAQVQEKVRTHPVGPPSKYAFNYELQVDVLETYDDSGTRYSWLSVVCCGTTYHLVMLVRVGGGTPTSRKCIDKFMNHWVKWAGWPEVVTVDRGTHNRGVFTRTLAAHGVYVRPVGLESPEQLGRGERHGALFKKNMKRVIKQHHIVTKDGMKAAAVESITAKNEVLRKGGFSTSQWVLGKFPRGVGHILDEEELGRLGVLENQSDPAGEFGIRAEYRLTARKAYVKECGVIAVAKQRS